jgi:hypothetical protein
MRRRVARTGLAFVAFVAMSLAVTACGGSAVDTSPAGTAPPTNGPSAASTLAGTALTQTLTAQAGGRSVKFPERWLGTDNLGILYVISSQAANDRLLGLGRLDPGDVFIQFSENTVLSGTTTDPAVHLPDNLKLLASGMGLTLPAPHTITSAGRPGARIDAQNDKLAMIAMSLKVRDDLFADIIAYVPPGEQAAREQLILEIVESLRYPDA